MAKKKYPTIDEWFHLAARHGSDENTFEETIEALTAELGTPNKSELSRLKSGYYTGIMNSAFFHLQGLAQYLRTDDIKDLGEDVKALYEKYEAKLRETQAED